MTDSLVGVVEDERPSNEFLSPRPGVSYRFIQPSSPPPEDALDVDALFIWNVRSPFLRENWSGLHRLRWVHAATAGVEWVLFPELVDSDVVVTNSRFVFDRALAEYVIGMMLVLSKDFRTTFAHQAEHRWEQRESDTLDGKVVVVVGVGPIARRTAQLATALGMVVRGIGRTARTGDPDFGDIASPESIPCPVRGCRLRGHGAAQYAAHRRSRRRGRARPTCRATSEAGGARSSSCSSGTSTAGCAAHHC